MVDSFFIFLVHYNGDKDVFGQSDLQLEYLTKFCLYFFFYFSILFVVCNLNYRTCYFRILEYEKLQTTQTLFLFFIIKLEKNISSNS
jgi:hypothetical protein